MYLARTSAGVRIKMKKYFIIETQAEDNHDEGTTVVYYRSIWFWELLYGLMVGFMFYVLPTTSAQGVVKFIWGDVDSQILVNILRFGMIGVVVVCTILLALIKLKNDEYAGQCEKKDKIIADLRKVAARFTTVHDNLHLMYLRHLESIGETLSFGGTDRISLYVLEDGQFVQVARHSKNPEYKRTGRLIYPIDQGVIAKTLEDNELVCYASLPDYKADAVKYADYMLDKFGMCKSVVDKLTMHPRFVAGLRISSADGNEWKAVLILESDRRYAWKRTTLEEVLQRNKLCMYKLMCDFPDSISLIHAAERVGL